jgi:hypothetical protein
VQQGGAQIQIALGAAQNQHHRQIDEQPKERDQHDTQAIDIGGLHQPLDRFDSDKYHDQDQCQAVDEGCNDLSACEAVGMSSSRRAARDPTGKPCEPQCKCVREHVAGIAQQRE